MKLDLSGNLILGIKYGFVSCIIIMGGASCSNSGIYLSNRHAETRSSAGIVTNKKIKVRIPSRMLAVDDSKLQVFVTKKRISNPLLEEFGFKNLSRHRLTTNRTNWRIDISPKRFKRGDYFISFFDSSGKLYEVPISLRYKIVTPFNIY